MMHQYDVIIIGSGLGGLVCGAILSRHGYKVCIFEKNRQIGGCLQTYARDKVVFDSGVHYIGGLDTGENLHQVFHYLGILDKLQLKRMDMDGFDHISFKDDPRTYRLAQGYDNFIEQLLREFPGERAALETYCEQVQDVCSKFPLYNLRLGDAAEKQSVLPLNAKEVISNITGNERLQHVLAGNNLLYAGVPDRTPFYVHALVSNSYIQSSWKCMDGGSQIAKWLSRSIREHGGEIHRHTEVKHIICEGQQVVKVELADGRTFSAAHFISNLHPAQTMAITQSDALRGAYRSRIQGLENSIGAFVLNVVLKPESFPYLNHNYYYHETDDVWAGTGYREEEWPLTYAMYVSAGKTGDRWAEGVSIMTYMRYDEMLPWKDTFNTDTQESFRGEDYEAFKQDRTERLLDSVERKFPGFRNCIQASYVATPLSYRDYLGTSDGSMYGILKDNRDPLRTMVSARTRLSNLYLTGQNLNLHGILGVTMSAVITCTELLGMEFLVQDIQRQQLKK